MILLKRLFPKISGIARHSIVSATALASVLLVMMSCAGNSAAPSASAVSEKDSLSPDAQKVVDRVMEKNDMEEMCGKGVEEVKKQVRKAVIALMFGPGLDNARKSGTAAGHYVSDRCGAINPDY